MPNHSPNTYGRSQDDGLEGRYANYFMVGHNACEFVLDFGQSYTESQVQMHSRIVTGSHYAKELLRVLARSIEQYEAQFGAIEEKD